MQVVGVDGCPGGWVAVAYDTEDRSLAPRVHRYFADLLAAYPDAACIGVDIPIGLAQGEPRRCDGLARRVLGPRRSSVFPAPDPRVLTAPTYEEALERSRSLTGAGISKQAQAIYPKILEVNWTMTPALQGRVVEVHPEVSFWALAGERPMAHHKGEPEGFAERRELLAAGLETAIPSREEARSLVRPAAADDVLDAIVAAWTARRQAEGEAARLPPDPSVDARGLRMEIVY
jgi:predicted RNase H-like nuclease